ncbi:MAG: glycosyltransferase family 4 protein [Rhodomicrobiaceae bacterium]
MSAMPVILQVIPALETGGAERTVIEVAEAIAAAGGAALVASEGGRLEGELAAAGGTLIRLPLSAKNPLTILTNARKLQAIIAERGVSLVHARSRAPAWSALIAARRAKVRFVTTYHGIYNQKGRLKSWYNGVMARGDLVIANSHYTAGIVKARHGTPDERLRVIPRGVDLARFSPGAVSRERLAGLRRQWGVADEARLVVLAARLTRWKGQITVIEAAAHVLGNPDFADVVFILAGDDQGRSGYKDELAGRISGFGLADRILMPGHCADMPAAFAAASLALAPSIEPEAFGRISIEAQAMGCPVIVSDIGALPETLIAASNGVADTGATGWIFPAGNADALAARIGAALRLGAGEEAVMAEAARKHVAASFSKQALQYRTLKVYDDLLDSSMAGDFDRKSSQDVVSRSWLHRIPT